MCRFLAYKGAPVLVSKLVYEPVNSLVHQSYQAEESEERLNGDGFGLGWYVPRISPEPALFVSVTPAWSNANLQHLTRKIESGLILAHVRAASVGAVSENNCHPFVSGRYLMMHNGGLPSFPKMKRILRRGLSDSSYEWIKGQTDSEHFFALFLDQIGRSPPGGAQGLAAALESAIAQVEGWRAEFAIAEPAFINAVVSDGERIVATRYVSEGSGEEPLSLHYSAGHRYDCVSGVCRLEPGASHEQVIVVASEKLTATESNWTSVPRNHLVAVEADQSVSTRAIVA